MTGFPLPATQTANQAAFRDSDSASRWLAAQPQANTAAMLSGFQTQIDAFNRYKLSPRERYKTMDVLRKAVFAVSNECRRRFEGKPLPLAAAEQSTLDAVRRLWRSYAVAYQHCLQACLDGDASLSSHSAKVAHRVLFCLRMEQMTTYAAGVEPGPGLWKNLHAVFLAAEQLRCTGVVVEDRLPGETSESTVAGQYAMALMLHLVQPFMLSSGQFAAVVRWLARWREQARVAERPDPDPKSASLLLDVSEDSPFHRGNGEARVPRWLSVGGVLRKIRRRIDSLAAGESPESLKLGGGLTADACMALLESLGNNLRNPPRVLPTDLTSLPKLTLGNGLVNIYQLLGGEGLDGTLHPTSAIDSHLSKEQLAVFGHVVRPQQMPAEALFETWTLIHREGIELALLRTPEGGSVRLALRSLLAIRQSEGYLLAVVTGLQQGDQGSLYGVVNVLSGNASPRAAEIRDRTTGKNSRHPALQLSTAGNDAHDMLLLPSGIMARATVIRFFDGGGQALPSLRLTDCLERGGEVEFWRVATGN